MWRIKPYESDALFAGISIDTDGFQSKSGPRTFEAVAFLRRHGADITRVRKMLRDDMKGYIAVAQAVSHAVVYKGAFAISVFDGEGLDSPTIGGAKAANQLLDISGIKASFVVTAYNDVIYVSATPGDYEMARTDRVVEQIIRPTGLLDPRIEVRPTKNQIDNLLEEINKQIDNN